MRSTRRFAHVLTTVLAAACSAPRSPSVGSVPPRLEDASTSTATEVDAAASLDAGVDAVAAVEPPASRVVDPLVDARMLPTDQPDGTLPAFRFVEHDWSKVSPKALPRGFTYVAEVRAKKVVRAIGVAPADAELARVLADRERAPAAERSYVELVWMRDGEVNAGSTSDLRRALAPIDSREKALVLVEYGHRRVLEWQRAGGKGCVGCGGRFVRSGAQGGFEIVGVETLLRNGPCPHSNVERYEALVLYAVSPDGVVRRRAEDPTPWPASPRAAQRTPCVGRDSEGSGRDMREVRSLGEYLAQLAHDEAISVRSFERLARELEAAAAPRALVERARTAARDEARHAKAMTALAVAHGASPRPVDGGALPLRPFRAWSVENAANGCVHETYSAVVSAYQGQHAPHVRARPVLERIARDEVEHARLAWDVHAWAASRADATLARELESTIDEAYADLETFVGAEPAREYLEGWTPPRAVAVAIVEGLRARLR